MNEPHRVPQRRRASDHHFAADRRARPDRRVDPGDSVRQLRFPGWPEQLVQFLTRYLFVALGVLFFNFTSGIAPTWMSAAQLNTAYALYFVSNTLLFWHASRNHVCPTRYRIAMWVDIVITAVSVLNDPYPIPPSLLVFIMVVLGNGMRYGMGLFREALIGCFAAAMLVLSLRYASGGNAISPGLVFLNLFGGIILVYAYILMGRIELSRAQLEYRSRIDTLTGLMNRRGLLETADQLFGELNRGHGRLVVMFADLDKFKRINDTHGHAAGDAVLQRFSAILRQSIRGSDIAARLGGDEFVLILTDTTLEQAERVAQRIQEQVAVCAQTNNLEYSVTIGLGEAPQHGTSLSDILERVDRALYQAKAYPSGGIMRCGSEAA
ncbi:MAG: GGDEF domain-containing protein [Gammaproteobacteria bacterium]|jgi:diguanylate cyclase (GGDEF)-like protein|nr:GGDEF domain-containing protein [Gammaproteobacteria bacterium]